MKLAPRGAAAYGGGMSDDQAEHGTGGVYSSAGEEFVRAKHELMDGVDGVHLNQQIRGTRNDRVLGQLLGDLLWRSHHAVGARKEFLERGLRAQTPQTTSALASHGETT